MCEALTILVTVEFDERNSVIYPFEAALELRMTLRALGHQAYIVKIASPFEAFQKDVPDLMVFPLAEGDQENVPRLRRRLEAAAIPIVGSGERAFAVATDKNLACARLREAGIQTPRGEAVHSTSVGKIHMVPAVVKPAVGGGSAGVIVAKTVPELRVAINAMLARFKQTLRVEEYVHGREFTVWIIENNGIASVTGIVEIQRDAGGIFDRSAKTSRSRDQQMFRCQPNLAPEDRARLLQTAMLAHEAVGASVYSRVDLILGADGPVVLEVNLAPRLSRDSGMGIHRATGMDFPHAISQILTEAVRRRNLLR